MISTCHQAFFLSLELQDPTHQEATPSPQDIQIEVEYSVSSAQQHAYSFLTTWEVCPLDPLNLIVTAP